MRPRSTVEKSSVCEGGGRDDTLSGRKGKQ